MKTRARFFDRIALTIAVFGAIGLSWEVVARLVESRTFPPLSTVFLWIGGDFPLLLVSAGATAARAILGLGFGVATGAAIGVLMSMHSKADVILTPVVSFLRPLPSSALILLFAIWFGLTPLSTLIVWFGCLWPVLISTRDEMRTIPREVHETLALLELPAFYRFTKVYSRALLPGILSGVRVAVSISIILTVTVELIIPPGSFFGLTNSWTTIGGRDIPWGLGSYLTHYYQQGHTTAILAAVLVSGLVGVILNDIYHELYVHLLKRNHLLDG